LAVVVVQTIDMNVTASLTRSLTLPFESDPEMRSGTTCNVTQKCVESTTITKTNNAATHPTKNATISKTGKKSSYKKKATTCSYKHVTPWTALSDLEYFDYYTTTPPTPIKNKRGEALFEVDRVLGKIVCACGTTNYLVKWRGYPNRDNSCITVLPLDFQAEWA
jgi:hypothetical protein